MKKPMKINHQPIGRDPSNLFGIQKVASNYLKPLYINPLRMSSYGYQYQLAYETESELFLNIGSSNPLLKFLLNSQHKNVVNLDLDINTKPDIVTAFPFLPFNNKSFDTVLCFQVLEHLPFSFFKRSINELKRVAKEFIIISLPDQTLRKSEKIKYFIYKLINRPMEWNLYKKKPIDIEHFWELGIGSNSIDIIIEIINNENLTIIKHFRNPMNRYHHFIKIKIPS